MHLNFFEARAPATLALALAVIETERARAKPPLARQLRLREHLANVIERADVNRRVGAWSFAEARLIHQDDAAQTFPTGKLRRIGRFVCGLGRTGSRFGVGTFTTFRLPAFYNLHFEFFIQERKQYLTRERGLAGAADSSDDHQPAQRNFHGEVFQVMQGGVRELQI